MANVLNSSEWEMRSASFDGSLWTIEIQGVFSETANGLISSEMQIQAGDVAAGTVSYEIAPGAPESDLWFVAESESGVLYSHKLWTEGGSDPASGTFEMSAPLDGAPWVEIGVSRYESEIDQPPGYEDLGLVTIVPTPDPAPPGGCEEIGRVTRSYVSAYNRYRVHVGQVRRQERRCVVADFNGAIPASRSIVAVRWDCTNPWVAKMSAPAINGREVQVTADFQSGGFAALRASVTLDNGEIYNQAFEFTVRDAPCFIENAPTNAGPFTLTAAVD